jgi:hypothetical protein
VRGDGFGFFGRNDDKGVLVGVNLIELLFGADKFERLRPIKSFAVAHS